MSDEKDTEKETPVSIDDALEAAMEAHGVGAESEPADEGETEPQSESKKVETPPSKGSALAAEPPPVTPDPGAPKPLAPPPFWKKEDKEAFARLPREAQDIIRKYDKDARSFVSRLENEMRQAGKAYAELGRVFTPEVQRELSLSGHTPITAIERLWNWHKALEADPRSAVPELLRRYGLDISDLAAPTEESGGFDPRVDELIAQNEALQQQLQAIVEGGETSAVRSQLDAFGDQRDESGELLRPHFRELEPAIKAILPLVYQEMAVRGEPQDDWVALHEAWERAAYANPDIRAELLSRQNEAQAVERSAKVAKAKRAATTLTGTPTPPVDTQKRPRGAEGALRMAFEKHGVNI